MFRERGQMKFPEEASEVGSSKALFPAERIILRADVDHAVDRIGRRIVSSSERNHRVNCASFKILSHSRRAEHLAIVQRSLHQLVIFFVVSRRFFLEIVAFRVPPSKH